MALSTALAAGSFLGLRIAGGSVTPHSQWVRAGLADAMTVSGSAAPDRTDRDRQVEDWFKTPVSELTSAPRTTVATPGALVPTTVPAYRSSPFERVPQTTVTTGALVSGGVSGGADPPASEPAGTTPQSTSPTTAARPRTTTSTTTTTTTPRHEQTGDASWYGAPPGTCAHRTIDNGTRVRVTNLATGASTTCVVSDYGPTDTSRIIDLSRDTFAAIADPGQGVIHVRLRW